MSVTFKMVPDSLREYFASETTTSLIRSITKEAGLVEPGAIANVVFRLITKDLSAHDFIDGTAEQLGLSTRRAQAIARALKELVLEKVRNELFVWGVDISAINVVNAPSLDDMRIDEEGGVNTNEASSPATERTVQLNTVGSVVAPEQKVPVRSVPSFLSRPQGKQEPQKAPGAPLIIHEEKHLPERSPSEPPRKKFFFPMNFFKPKPVPQSITAQIETGGAQQKPATNIESPKPPASTQKKVVFYSESKTPVTPFSTTASSDVINLQTFELARRQGGSVPAPQPVKPITAPSLTQSPSQQPPRPPMPQQPQGPLPQRPVLPTAPTGIPPAPQRPSAPSPIQSPSSERSQPKIDGNTIDLRNDVRS
jgi:hypothetical protein